MSGKYFSVTDRLVESLGVHGNPRSSFDRHHFGPSMPKFTQTPCYREVVHVVRRWTTTIIDESAILTPPSSSKQHQPWFKKNPQKTLERDVFWQCVPYAAASALTWPIVMFAQFNGANFDIPLGFWVYVVPKQAARHTCAR